VGWLLAFTIYNSKVSDRHFRLQVTGTSESAGHLYAEVPVTLEITVRSASA